MRFWIISIPSIPLCIETHFKFVLGVVILLDILSSEFGIEFSGTLETILLFMTHGSTIFTRSLSVFCRRSAGSAFFVPLIHRG